MNKLLDSPFWRHLIQFAAMAFIAGTAWATSQSDIQHMKKDQDETSQAVKDIRDGVNDIKVDNATTKQKVETLERQMHDLNRKIDTLLWRTAPNNPNSPYPQ